MSVKLSGLKAIAMDFDGTLVDSNHIKDQAFETIFSNWPEHQNAMIRWHLNHNSIDRQEKFRYFVEEVLALSGRSDLIRELTTKFIKITRQEIIDCPFVDGALDFLESINGRVNVYLISATPQTELNIIIEKRNLSAYFKKVFGAPIKKIDILKKIMVSEKASVDELLFIGDSSEDQYASETLGIHFIGRQSDRLLNKGLKNIYPNFFKIQDHINRYLKPDYI